ncbi:ABC transporter permease [Caenimonas aquaedulcis]|uniref:ABC transporter permease n=1 Tax=Caenimonas aquaedulcis TaxID=2793270 RepID=A0A931MGN5_9BURK|nr:ABC transporter permease [Caenimonas aquaedulcis]MBG9387994.1 ABC transporter permease [Caenimonas aquaedulcis]
MAVNGVAVAFLGFLVLPSLIVVVISFGDSNQIVFPPKGFSFNLFRRLLAEEGWISSAWLSFRVALAASALALVLGVPAAYALSRGRFPGRRWLALFLLSPIMVPHVVIALALYVYFVELGLSNGMLRLVLAHGVATVPFVIVTANAGLRQIDPSLERVARVMGAGRFTVLRKVTLPLLKPAMVAGGLFAFLISFDEVVISLFVARAGYTTLPVKMFSSIQFEVSPVLAAISTMLTALSVAVCILAARLQPNAST